MKGTHISRKTQRKLSDSMRVHENSSIQELQALVLRFDNLVGKHGYVKAEKSFSYQFKQAKAAKQLLRRACGIQI